MHARLIAAAVGTLLAAANADAYRLDRVVGLATGEGSAFADVDVETLSGGRFVAAWSVSGFQASKVPAHARVFDSSGAPLTETVPCTENPGETFMRYPILATTLGDHVVFGCELEAPSGLTTATLRTFTDALQPVGPRTTYDGGITSSFLSLVSVDETSFIARVYGFLDGLVEWDRHHRLDIAGNELHVFGPRIGSLVPHGPDRFLKLRYRRSRTDQKIALRRQLLSGTGAKLGTAKRVHRVSAEPWVRTRAVPGIAGRTAILIQAPPAENFYRSFEEMRVVLVDAGDAATTHEIDVVLNGFRFVHRGVDAWALPMKSGFAVLWSRKEESDYFPRPLYGVWLQRFSEAGAALGGPIPLLPGVATLGRPALDSDGETYLVPTSRESSHSHEFEIRRLSETTACGDANGDGEVNQTDVESLLASLTSSTPQCDPCVCDVDRSGTVDEADSVALEASVLERVPLECPACAN